MSGLQLQALLPIITLSSLILIQMMFIAFARNLRLTVSISVIALLLTALSFFPMVDHLPISATPLIQLDGFALFYSGLVLLGALMVTFLSYDYLRDQGERQDEFFMLLLLSCLGALILVSSNHFASFILGLELLGVSLYTMMSYPTRGLFTLEAALKYLILSGVSSAFILFGAALIYAIEGKLGFTELAGMNHTSAASGQFILLMGSTMIFAGIMFKLSLAPFHLWTPDVYDGAPAPVTAFLATVSKGAIFALALRLFTTTGLIDLDPLLRGLSFVAMVSILAGNLLALLQDNVKRILAYSSIAHMGYLAVAFVVAGKAGGQIMAMEAASYFLFAYFLTTLLAFSVVTIMSIADHEVDTTNLGDYEGLFWRRPALAAVFTATLLSLAGIPLTAGFIGKFYIFSIGVAAEAWLLMAFVVIGSGIGIFYYLRIIFAMTKAPRTDVKIEIPTASGWVAVVLTVSLVLFGVYPSPIIDLIGELMISFG